MNSQTTIVEQDPALKIHNLEVLVKKKKELIDALGVLDPELHILIMALSETRIRPILLVPVVKMLSNLDMGNGFGAVNIVMHDHNITTITGKESIMVNEKITFA